MGLDITAYGKLQPAEPLANEDDEHDAGILRFHDNTDFPGRLEGLDPKLRYTSDEEFRFRAGSYGGYNAWRDWLARLAGMQSAEETWGGKRADGPFFELLCFSDCEGTIGPVVSKKLAKDFSDYQEKADNPSGDDVDYFVRRYNDWRKAFELAADGGCVEFH